jgi:hypothetical protein
MHIESNNVTDLGVQALVKGLEMPAWKYLQAIKLDNQKKLLSTEAETEPLHALARNRTVIKLSLRVRNLSQRDQINLIVTRKHRLVDDQGRKEAAAAALKQAKREASMPP